MRVDQMLKQMCRSSETPKGGDWLHNLLDDLVAAPLVNESTLDSKRKSPLADEHIYLLIALSNGFTINSFAKEVNENEETIRSRLKQCRYYLQANSMHHAVAIAIRQNII